MLFGITTAWMLTWCYLIWYIVMAVNYFDADWRLWATEGGISAALGLSLLISLRRPDGTWIRLGMGPIMRAIMVPFCVASFAALVKGKGFVLIFSPRAGENLWALGACAAFCVMVFGARLALVMIVARGMRRRP